MTCFIPFGTVLIKQRLIQLILQRGNLEVLLANLLDLLSLLLQVL